MTTDAHGRPRPREEPLSDPDLPVPSHAERARTLASRLTTGALCTLAVDPEGHPYGSFVTVAFDGPTPVLLMSEIAEHTRNLRRDPRASLLFSESRKEDPLANGRVTLLGRCEPAAEGAVEATRGAFLATHPQASYYADYRDFGFWRLTVESVRYIGGYGRMSWVDAEGWHGAEPDPLAASVDRIVEHMNDDHADAVLAYARALTRAREATSAVMTGIDRYGFDLSVELERGRRPARVAFPEQVESAGAARKALVALADATRSHQG